MPRVVWLVTAAHLMLLVGYSVLVPTFRAPDELFYVDHMRRLAGLTATSADATGPLVDSSVLSAAESSPVYQAGTPPVDIADAVPPEDRPTFAESTDEPSPPAADDPATDLTELTNSSAASVTNPVARRPPLASWLGAAVLSAAGAVVPGWPWSFDRTVALLRLVDVAFVATLPLLAWASARRFGCPARASLTVAVAVLAIPQLSHVGSVVGEDAVVVTLGAVVFLLGARVVTGDSSVLTAVLAGVSCGLALLASGIALVLLPWMVAAYFLAPNRRGEGDPGPSQRRLRRGLPLIVVALAMVVGGWWHLGHLVVDRGVALGLDRVPTQGPGAGSTFASRILADVWGAFGWREAVLPTAVVVGLTVVLVAALGIAVARGRVRAVRVRLAFLLVPAAALAVLAVGAALWSTLSGDEPLRVEGRVVLIGVVGLVVVAIVGLDQLRPTPTRALPAVVFVVAIGLQLVAMAAIIQRYWTGDSLGTRLRTVLAYSPLPPGLVFLATVVALGLVVWAMVELLRGSWQPAPNPPAPAPTGASVA